MPIANWVIWPTFSSSVMRLRRASIFCELSRADPAELTALRQNSSLSVTSMLTGPPTSSGKPYTIAKSIVVRSRPARLEESALGTGRPKQSESVTTAKASAVFFIVFLFSLGNQSAERAYSLISEGNSRSQKRLVGSLNPDCQLRELRV